MLTRLTRIALAGLLCVPSLAVPATATAQSDPPRFVCMARPGSTPGSPTFVAVVPASAQSAMADNGYVPQACLVDPAQLAVYRAKVCHLAYEAPTEVQGQFEQQFNVPPRQLCDMANAIAGV